jgi:hypothetical protein
MIISMVIRGLPFGGRIDRLAALSDPCFGNSIMSAPDHDQKPDDKDDERRFRAGKEVAEQIWREQQLTNSRMMWNLTFQSFMLAAFILTFGQNNDVRFALALRLVICLAGFLVALVTRWSVVASQNQRDFLKGVWSALYPEPDHYAYPRPFAEYQHSLLGRRAPAEILSVLMSLWVFFFGLAIAAYCYLRTGIVWFE